jgi:menaquinone-dependent protoporphyrinogen IX oxidase
MDTAVTIVYFSRTGHTRRVAEEITRRLGGNLLAVTEKKSRLGLTGYSKSLIEALWRVEPKIELPVFEPMKQRLVVIGTPVWGWRLSSPIRALIKKYQWMSCKVAFFCTMGGSGASQVFHEMTLAVGHEPIATIALKEADIDANRIDKQLDEFCQTLRRS